MRLEGRPRWEGQLPSWLEIGTHVRVVGNSNEHNYAIGGEVVVVEIDPTRAAFRARRADSDEVGNWLVASDVLKVARLGWDWLRELLPPEDVELLSAFDGLETLELKEEVKAELVKQVPDLKAAILATARGARGARGER